MRARARGFGADSQLVRTPGARAGSAGDIGGQIMTEFPKRGRGRAHVRLNGKHGR
jgi:hypothetical protein